MRHGLFPSGVPQSRLVGSLDKQAAGFHGVPASPAGMDLLGLVNVGPAEYGIHPGFSLLLFSFPSFFLEGGRW